MIMLEAEQGMHPAEYGREAVRRQDPRVGVQALRLTVFSVPHGGMGA